MKVLSLFDGIACGMLALKRAGIEVESYFASEIEESAIKVATYNNPNIIEIGDVQKVTYSNNTLFTENGEFLTDIDLLIGGSPCQGFSRAGKMLNFEDERSKLFWEFVRILKEVNPKYFLLENVYLKKEWEDVITEALNVTPITINSSLVSAQLRKRTYWTNIPNITKPEDKGIKLQSILEEGYTDREKSLCIAKGYSRYKNTQAYYCRRYFGRNFCQVVFTNKEEMDLVKNKWKENPYFEDSELTHPIIRTLTSLECERLQTLPDNYTACLNSDILRKETIGNGWTVDVIAHIFQNLKKKSF